MAQRDRYDTLARAMADLGWLQAGDFVVARVAAALRQAALAERAWTRQVAAAAQAYLDTPNAMTRAQLEHVLNAVNRRDESGAEPDPG